MFIELLLYPLSHCLSSRLWSFEIPSATQSFWRANFGITAMYVRSTKFPTYGRLVGGGPFNPGALQMNQQMEIFSCMLLTNLACYQQYPLIAVGKLLPPKSKMLVPKKFVIWDIWLHHRFQREKLLRHKQRSASVSLFLGEIQHPHNTQQRYSVHDGPELERPGSTWRTTTTMSRHNQTHWRVISTIKRG